MDRGDEPAAPVTTRLGRPGASDRRLRVALAAVAAGLLLAVLKPWDLLPAPPVPRDEVPASADPAVAAPARSGPSPWTRIGEQLACFSGASWTIVLDELDDGRVTRSWTRVEPGPASGPGDPGIVRLHAYADAVPRIGFCPPAAGRPGGGTPAESAARVAPEVEVWRRDPGAAGGAFTIVERRVVAADATGTGGLLLVPAVSPPARASWAPGTYVVRVRLPGVPPDAGRASWFAVELRGPWLGVDAASPPAPAATGAPETEPAPARTSAPETEPAPARTGAPAPSSSRPGG
jgi:hypothetical protein